MLRLFFLLLLNILFAASSAQQAILKVEPGGNNSCSDDRLQVIKKKWCKRAAKKQKGVDKYFSTENNPNWPKGCYFCGSNVQGCAPGTWWNNHKTGTGKGKTNRLCALTDWKGCKRGGCKEPTDDDDDDDDDSGGGDMTVKTLFVGDSDIEYWKTTNTDFPQSVNVGVGGWTAKKVEKNVAGFLAKSPPTDWVVLVCGENDFAEGSSVKKTFKYFKKIVTEVLKTVPGVRVLYIGTKPEPGTTNLHNKYKKYDSEIRAFAKKLSNNRDETTLLPPLVMIDTYPQFISIGNSDTLYQNDELHLSKSGYSYWIEWTNFVFNNANSQCTVYQDNTCIQE